MPTATARQRAQRAEFGACLREIRKGTTDLSQEDLVERADLNRTYVGSVERGEGNGSLDNIHRLADALGVSARDPL